MMKRLVQRWWPEVLIATVSLALYARTITADFLRWDDRQNILLNPWIEHNVLSMIWKNPYYNMYIPVTYTFWDWLWLISPHNPMQFHIANIVLHACNAVLVYMLARLFLARLPLATQATSPSAPTRRKGKSTPLQVPSPSAASTEVLGAILAALIFACHPLQVETVAWISTGRDLLAAFFSLWAGYIVLTREKKSWMALSVVLFSTACLCKPSVAVVPVALAVVAYGVGLLTRPRAITFGVWIIPGLIVTIITKRIQQLDADLRLTPMGLGDRLLVALDSLSFYVQKFFVPYPLAADYGRTREFAIDGNLWIYALIAIGVLGALFVYFRKRVDRRYLYFAVLFVLLLSPVLGLIPFQFQAQSTVSDRYAYFPLMGAGLLFGALLAYRHWAALVVSTLIIGTFSVLTFNRAGVWAANEIFFQDMLAKNERSHVALSSLGVEYILTKRYAQAEDVLMRATVLKPMDVIPRTNLAQLYLLVNRPDRVVSEIAPLLDNPEFLRINQTETRALASAYRLAARAHWGMDLWTKANDYYCRWFWGMDLWTKANDYYCRWFRLDYSNQDGQSEIQSFMKDAKKHGITLSNCEIRVAQ